MFFLANAQGKNHGNIIRCWSKCCVLWKQLHRGYKIGSKLMCLQYSFIYSLDILLIFLITLKLYDQIEASDRQ